MVITDEISEAVVRMLSQEAQQILANGWRLANGRDWFSVAAKSNEPTIQTKQMEALAALGLFVDRTMAENRGMYYQYDYYFTRLGFEVARRCATGKL